MSTKRPSSTRNYYIARMQSSQYACRSGLWKRNLVSANHNISTSFRGEGTVLDLQTVQDLFDMGSGCRECS
ncbi:Protein of unknown function [Gryllus bimaculatus]|nr:Protein of unknown function [Gryllus bimaculatus]